MQKSLVSVIVPTYNRAYCLAATLDSALNQTHQHVEIIVRNHRAKSSCEIIVRNHRD